MQFIKKNYEKILLGLVLVGLVAVAFFMLLLVANEKQRLADQRNSIISRAPRELPEVVMAAQQELLKRADSPATFFFSDNTNKLFNPVRWQKAPDGKIFKNPAGSELSKVEVTAIRPLYFSVSLDRVENYDSGPRIGFMVEHQAQRTKFPVYVSVNEKKEYTVRGGNKESLTLLKLENAGDNAQATVQLSDVETNVTITKAAPYKRVEGYVADLKYPPENKVMNDRRQHDQITIAGEKYEIANINADEVVLSAISNNKKWPIKYNAQR